MRLPLIFFLLWAAMPAFPLTKLETCVVVLPKLIRTEEADRKWVQELWDTRALTNEFTNKAKEPNFSEWTARNSRRGSRASLPSEAAYKNEMALMRKFRAATELLSRNPTYEPHNQVLANVIHQYLTQTGVPCDVAKVGKGPYYQVVVRPLSKAEYREWNKNERGITEERELPKLVLAANHQRRGELQLLFQTKDFSGRSAAHFSSSGHIGLGEIDLFDLRLTSIFLHEDTHRAHGDVVNVPWTKATARTEGSLQTRLPQVECVADVTSPRLKGTPYEKSYLIEEAEATFRQARQSVAEAKRLKQIYQKYKIPEALTLWREAVFQAYHSLERSQAFTDANNDFLYYASTGGTSRFVESNFTLRPCNEWPYTQEVVFANGKKFRFNEAQFPEIPAAGGTPPQERRRLEMVKKVMEDVRLTSLQIESSGRELRGLIHKELEPPK